MLLYNFLGFLRSYADDLHKKRDRFLDPSSELNQLNTKSLLLKPR